MEGVAIAGGQRTGGAVAAAAHDAVALDGDLRSITDLEGHATNALDHAHPTRGRLFLVVPVGWNLGGG